MSIVEQGIIPFPGEYTRNELIVRSSFVVAPHHEIVTTRYPSLQNTVYCYDRADIVLQYDGGGEVLHFNELFDDPKDTITITTNPREKGTLLHDSKYHSDNIQMHALTRPDDVIKLLYFIGYVNAEKDMPVIAKTDTEEESYQFSLSSHFAKIARSLAIEKKAWDYANDTVDAVAKNYYIDLTASFASPNEYAAWQRNQQNERQRGWARVACVPLAEPNSFSPGGLLTDYTSFLTLLHQLPWSERVRAKLPQYIADAQADTEDMMAWEREDEELQPKNKTDLKKTGGVLVTFPRSDGNFPGAY